MGSGADSDRGDPLRRAQTARIGGAAGRGIAEFRHSLRTDEQKLPSPPAD